MTNLAKNHVFYSLFTKGFFKNSFNLSFFCSISRVSISLKTVLVFSSFTRLNWQLSNANSYRIAKNTFSTLFEILNFTHASVTHAGVPARDWGRRVVDACQRVIKLITPCDVTYSRYHVPVLRADSELRQNWPDRHCKRHNRCVFAWLGRMSDLRSRSPGFDSRSGRYQNQVVTIWMGDCLQTGKPTPRLTQPSIPLG